MSFHPPQPQSAYAEAGVDEFIVPDRSLGSGPERLKAMDLLNEQVFASLR